MCRRGKISRKLKLFLKPQLTFQDGVGVPLASLQVKFPIQLSDGSGSTRIFPGFWFLELPWKNGFIANWTRLKIFSLFFYRDTSTRWGLYMLISLSIAPSLREVPWSKSVISWVRNTQDVSGCTMVSFVKTQKNKRTNWSSQVSGFFV